MLLVTLTQKMMASRLLELDTLSCTVLEVKVVEGLGTTIDVRRHESTFKELIVTAPSRTTWPDV